VPASLNVQLEGLPATTSFEAVKTVLTGPGPDAVNEDGRPPVVKPETPRLALKPSFDCEAPANSLMILRVNQAVGAVK
jgi:hypothetical protein